VTAAYVVIASEMGTNAYPPVIASEAKQSIYPARKHGLLRRNAPRNDASVVQLLELQEQGWSYIRP